MAIVQTPQYWIKNITIIGMVAILAACGGGGGSSDDGAKNPPPANDTTPNAFTFTAVKDAEVNAPVISTAITISGINTATPISITGGEYAIGGGAYTATSGTITNNQRVTVKLTSSENTYQEATATLKVGDKTAIFSVTTEPDVTPDTFAFVAKDEAMPGESYTSNTITVSGIDVAVPVSITGGEYAIDNGDFTTAAATVSAGQTIVIQATAAPTLDSIVDVELTIGGVKGIYSIITPVDKTPPTAEFMFPPPVSMTDGASVLVRGVASDDYSKVTAVTVNGKDVRPTGDNFATWEVEVPLEPGNNKLVVETTDAAENASTNAAEVMVRRGAITDAFPDEENQFDTVADFVIDRLNNRLLTVSGDDSVVTSVNLSTGQRTVAFSFSPSSFYLWSVVLDDDSGQLFFRDDRSRILSVPVMGETPKVEYNNQDLGSMGFLTLDKTEETAQVITGDFDRGNLIAIDPELTSFDVFSLSDDSPYSIHESFGIAWDKERYLLTNYRNASIVAVKRLTGEREIFSNNSENFSGEPFATPPNGALTGITIDKENNSAVVVEAYAGKIFAINLDTGNRTLISNSSTPNTGVEIGNAYGIHIHSSNSYAFVADKGLKAVIAVDLETGHRVVFSKSTTTP